jgi:hypothetical protein
LHVDGYATTYPVSGEPWLHENDEKGSLQNPRRWNDEGGTGMPARAYVGALPYWNGYVYYTAPHEDGECDEHKPEQGPWRTSAFTLRPRDAGEEV